MMSNGWRPVHRAVWGVGVCCLIAGCGGGGGDGSTPNGDPALAPAPVTGALVYKTGGELRHLDLGTGEQHATPIDLSAGFDKLGHGAGQFILLLNSTLSAPRQIPSVWQRWTGQGFETTAGLGYALEPRAHGGGYIGSRLQPSPDGARISFVSKEHERLGSPFLDYLYVVDARSGDALTLAEFTDAVWLDADTLVGVKPQGLYRIEVREAALEATRIGDEGLAHAGAAPSAPSLSPDGLSVVFVQDGAVWRIGLDGQGLAQLTQRTDPAPAWPTWSPDGLKLAVVESLCASSTSFDFPRVHWIDASKPQQVLAAAPVMQDRNGAKPYSCAPVYWIGS